MEDQPVKQPVTLWVPVDRGGPVGVFLSEGEARVSLEPYLRAHWSGALFCWTTDAPVTPETDLFFLMPRDTAATVPVFVGVREDVEDMEESLRASGLTEDASDIEFRIARLGLLPPAVRRLNLLLSATERPDPGSKALETFIKLTEKEMLASASDEEVLRRLPLAAFVCAKPKVLKGQSSSDEDGSPSEDAPPARDESSSVNPPSEDAPPSSEDEPSGAPRSSRAGATESKAASLSK